MGLYERLVRLLRPLVRFFFPVTVVNCPEHLPERGLIVASNHLSNMDAVFLALFLPRPLTFLAKKELFHWPIVGSIVKRLDVIPLSRDGGDAAMVRLAARELKSGKVMTIFPQGRRLHHAPVKEEFKGGVGMLAVLSEADILPVAITTRHFRVRPFRKTVVSFGTLFSPALDSNLGKKEQALAISDRTFEEIYRLEESARELIG